jgi:cobalt-zinc-cadmium efflux system membrane fusion protein
MPNKPMKVVIFLFLIAALCSCGSKSSTSEPSGLIELKVDTFSISVKQFETMGLRFTSPIERDLKPEIYANGVITSMPNSRASVSVNIESKVEHVFIRAGMKVKKGQPLFSMTSLDLLELQDKYAVAISEVELYKAEFERQTKLLENKVGALVEYQNARSKLQVATSNARTLKKKLEVLGINPDSTISKTGEMSSVFTVFAPIDGQIYKANAKVGDVIEDHDILAEIVNTELLQAEIYVFESNLTQVKEGQEVDIEFISHSIAPIKGKVTYITRVIDPATRAFTLQVDFKNPKDSKILPDMNIRGKIIGTDSVLTSHTVPLTALIKAQDSYYAFFAQEKADRIVFRKRKVQVGNIDSQYAQLMYIVGNPILADKNLLLLESEFNRLNVALSN